MRCHDIADQALNALGLGVFAAGGGGSGSVYEQGKKIGTTKLKFIGVGESIDDLETFSSESFVDAILTFDEHGAAAD